MNATNPRTEIERKVIQLAAEQVGADPQSVRLDTHFHEDLDYDSLDDVELVIQLEETFEFSVPDGLAEQVRTVGDAVRLAVDLQMPSEQRAEAQAKCGPDGS